MNKKKENSTKANEIGKGKNERRKIKHGQAQKKLTSLSGKNVHILHISSGKKSRNENHFWHFYEINVMFIFFFSI